MLESTAPCNGAVAPCRTRPCHAAPSRTLACQFLFRNHNVGKSKSLSAIEAARRINPSLKSTPLQDRVAPSTEPTLTLTLTLALTLI